MKKFVLSIVMMSVLVPVSLFAKPSYEEVVNTVKSVMGVYGLSLMSGMFGPAIPDGALEIDAEENCMGYTFSYNNFPAKTFLNSMNAMSAMMGELNDDEELECPFDTMSGVIKTKGAIDNLDMNIDLTLKGGGVKTLKLYVNTDDNEATVIVNGQEYSNLEEVFEDL